MPDNPNRFPFLFGTQYYRAPTPEPDCWEADLRNIRQLGFNAVKYFLQWRWSHRAAERFYFEDLDRLMDLAGDYDLGVTLNFILDVAPVWLYEAFPDAKQVDSRGRVFEPYAVGHRQIGGHPGPCYRHPGALAARQRFVTVAIEHFRAHPALQMWDVWNEPELCFPQRTPNMGNMACYCHNCQNDFWEWLQAKYASLERLNKVWGRPYERWDQVELPRDTGTITDFVDWREFHLDTMAGEAAWRLDAVRMLDPDHGRYLHVVPNSYFSAVTCADDFAMAEDCEIFAATMTGGPAACMHVISAGRDKACYNVESHINFGSIDMHQPVIEFPQLLKDLVPQVGMGIKGFLYWQYRSETLGFESPAWGIVRADGSPRPVTGAIHRFWDTIKPLAPELRKAFPAQPEVGIWRSRKNEIFHFCLQGQVQSFNSALEAYIQALYWDNLPFRLVNHKMLETSELSGLKLLVLPNPYYFTQDEADTLDAWVQAGGVLISEAHLAGYNASTGRHSKTVPGNGLAEKWCFHETETTSPYHLHLEDRQAIAGQAPSEDVRKALAEFGTSGGEYIPIRLYNGKLVWGAHRYAELAGEGLESLGSFDGQAMVIGHKGVGQGQVFYCGTDFGMAAQRDGAGLNTILQMAAAAAGLQPQAGLSCGIPGTVHLDILSEDGRPRFAVVVSRAGQDQIARIVSSSTWRGLFSGLIWKMVGETEVNVPANFVEIFIIE